MSSLGLRMDNNVIQVAVGLRLGLSLCEPHHCRHCGSEVDSLGTHGLSCRYSRGRHRRHAEINGQGSYRDPLDLPRSPAIWSQQAYIGQMASAKRPGRASILPWRARKRLVWDVTAWTPWPPPTVQLQPEKWGQWQARQRGGRKPSTSIWSPVTTSCP